MYQGFQQWKCNHGINSLYLGTDGLDFVDKVFGSDPAIGDSFVADSDTGNGANIASALDIVDKVGDTAVDGAGTSFRDVETLNNI